MAGIFTDEELKAATAVELDDLPADPAQPVIEQPQDDQPRDEQGRFASPEEQPAADPEGDDKQRMVPQPALHAERERRKAAEAEVARFKEQFAALQALKEQIAQRKPEPLPPVDDTSGVEHLRNRLGEMERQQVQTQQRLDYEAVNRREMEGLGAVMRTSEDAFRAEKPDYDAAIEHVVTARAQELALYGIPPAQIQRTIAEEAADIVRTAVSLGRNPAEMGYQIAMARGYRPASAQQPSGGAVATIDAIARGQQVGKSVGQGAGVPTKELNAEAIARMSPDEFEALYSTEEGRRLVDNL